jgi:endonuclease/exonuclease/phosphatase family metal-dependent hydrolase
VTAPLRCLTLNLWGAEPPLERRMQIVAAGLTELAPDVVALQEVREVPGKLENQAATLAQRCGYRHVFAPAVVFGGGHEGLAILARTPIVAQASIELPHATDSERRILLSAQIETAAGPIWVHTTHLNYRLHHGRERQDQVMAVDREVAARAGDLPQIVMGDFNARPESDEIRWLRGLTNLDGRRVHYQDAWERLHPGQPGWTWASANPYTAPLRFLEPDRRIDYIFVTTMRKDGRGTIRDCRIVFDRAEPDGAFASDHFGLLADVQIPAGL